jgi:predicted nucleic acid-binding protein
VRIASSPVYIDTSALAKLYVAEAESRLLERALVGRRDLLVSDLAVTELVSVLMRRVREGSVAVESATLIHRTLVQGLAVKVLHRVSVDGSVHRDAERFLMRFGDRIALRAADAMHLALATRSGARSFVTFDRRLKFAARAHGEFDLPTA